MKIESPRFGTLVVEPSRIIEFPRGLIGFENCKRFSLFHAEGGAPSFFILQSLDDAAIAFHIADPAHFGFNYEIALSDDDAAMVKLTDPAVAAVVVMLVKEADGVRANLNAPLVLNIEARLGVQHVFARLNYEVMLKGK